MKVKLIDLCTPKQWKTLQTSELLEEGYPVYGANGIIGYYSEYNHEKSVIAITCRGATCGTINITVPESYVTGNAMCLDNVRSDVLQKYLYYCLQHYDFNNVISGSAQPQITRQGLEKVEIELCSPEEQRRIITILDNVSAEIAGRKQQNQKLEELIKSRFVEMFGELEANPHKYMVTSLQTLIDHGMITYHLDGNHGGDYPRSEEFSAKGVPYIGANCIVDGRIDFRIAKHLPIERANRLRKGIAKDSDVLFAHNATVGPVVVLETQEPKVILSTSLTAYRCNTESINPYYLSSYMLSDGFVKQYSAEMKQTTRNQVPITAQKKYLFMVPPIELQEQFAAFVSEVDKSKLAVKQSLEKLETLKKSLMQQYFGGK